MKTTKEFIKKYIQNTEQISVLSSPKFESDVKVDDYTKILHENFVLIGKLASENREILDTYVFPILNAEELTRENKEILREAFTALVDGYTMENVDIALAVLISDKLLEDALNQYTGAILLVSHDEMFVRNIKIDSEFDIMSAN